MNEFVAATRKYRVLYSVTRTEYYEIEATSPEEAAQRAFRDGKLVDAGETTDVTGCDIEDITPTAQRYDKGPSATTTSRRLLRSSRRPG
jgi:hypothetical protein